MYRLGKTPNTKSSPSTYSTKFVYNNIYHNILYIVWCSNAFYLSDFATGVMLIVDVANDVSRARRHDLSYGRRRQAIWVVAGSMSRLLVSPDFCLPDRTRAAWELTVCATVIYLSIIKASCCPHRRIVGPWRHRAKDVWLDAAPSSVINVKCCRPSV